MHRLTFMKTIFPCEKTCLAPRLFASSYELRNYDDTICLPRVTIAIGQIGNISDFVLSACSSTVQTWSLRGYQKLQVECSTSYIKALQAMTRLRHHPALWMYFLKPMCGLQIFPQTTTGQLRLRTGPAK